MKAILRKDLYEMVTSMRMIWFILVVFTAVAFLNSNGAMFTAYLIILPASLANSILNLEERIGWEATAGFFPVRRREIVLEKYVLSMILTLAGTVCVMLVYVSYILRGEPGVNMLQIFLQFMAMGMLTTSILLPFTYKFGADKGRYIYMGFIIVAVLLIMSRLKENQLVLVSGSTIVWAMFLGTAVLFIASILISIRIYEKKEITG